MKETNIKKYFYQILSIFAALLLSFSIAQIPVQAAAKPGTVKLSSIKATDYNKINIKWKKTSGATNYIIYYKKAGSGKWIKVKTVDNTKSSYTHTSSKKFPITVGQKYQYTVKAYNKKTKKAGSYNTKGLTAKTLPQKVILSEITLNSDKTQPIISWKRASGCTDYIIYRKTGNNSWEYLVTVPSSRLMFADSSPIEGSVNYYMVRAYYSPTRTYGKYNSTGLSIKVPKENGGSVSKPTLTPVPDEPKYTEEQFAAEVFRLTNLERIKYGEPQVQYNEDLHKAAMQRAKEISVKFSHTRPDGTDSTSILSEYGIPDYNGSENIAAGYTCPEDVIEGWMNSPGHRVSLLNTYSTHLGVGVYYLNDVYYCVQEFTAYGQKEKLTIDANGGYFPTLNNASVYDMYFYHGTKLKYERDLPKPVKNGYIFVCWEDENGCRYSGRQIGNDMTLHAIWK